jgi:hypothetical protein
MDALARRAASGDRDAQRKLEDLAQQFLDRGEFLDAATAFKELAIAFRIAEGNATSAFAAKAEGEAWLRAKCGIFERWISGHGQAEPIPRTDLPKVEWHEYVLLLDRAGESEHVACLIQLLGEALEARGIEFFSPGGSLRRWATLLLWGMANGKPFVPAHEELLKTPLVRVPLDLLADVLGERKGK